MITIPRWLKAVTSGKTLEALGNRNYRLLWIGQMGHSAAFWSESVARSWLIWELTGSATLLAVVNLLRAVPILVFGLLAGVTADRFNKRKILITCQSVTLANYIVLAALITTGAVEVWHVLLSAFIMGSSMAFNQPTRMSLVPRLVEEDKLANAIALNSAAMNVNRILGPAGAGLLIAPLGIGGVYFVSAGIYVVALATTIRMRVPPITARSEKTSVLTDMAEAFRYVYKEKSIFALILLALIPMTLGHPYMTLLPIFADRVLGVGESGYGFLLSAVGTGALIAVLIIATLGSRLRSKGLLILVGIFCFGAFLVAFSQSTLFPLSLVIIALAGFMSTGMMVLINTSLLTITPKELHGRVMAVYRLDHGLMPLGTMVMGLLADGIGAPSTLLIMGGICALLALFMGMGNRRVRGIQ